MNHRIDAKLILVCPDVAASHWDEFFHLPNLTEVSPRIVELDQWGARVELDGVTYTADADDMQGYPNEGSYYLSPVATPAP